MGCCNEIRPENAARHFSQPAPLLCKPRVKELLQQHRGGNVLEIGAGCLRNAMFLMKCGFNVSVLEVPAIEERFSNEYARFRRAGGKVHFTFPKRSRFDIALSTFAIETICRPLARTALLRSTAAQLRRSGFVLVSVRGPSDLVTAHAKGVPCGDGFVTPNKTFARSFTRRQLEHLLRDVGFGRIEFLHKPEVKAPELLHAVAWKKE